MDVSLRLLGRAAVYLCKYGIACAIFLCCSNRHVSLSTSMPTDSADSIDYPSLRSPPSITTRTSPNQIQQTTNEMLQQIRKELGGELFYVKKSQAGFHGNHWYHIGEYYTSYFGSYQPVKPFSRNTIKYNSSSPYNSNLPYQNPSHREFKSKMDTKLANLKKIKLYVVIEDWVSSGARQTYKITEHLTTMSLFLMALGFSGETIAFQTFGIIDLDNSVVFTMHSNDDKTSSLEFTMQTLSSKSSDLIQRYIRSLNARSAIKRNSKSELTSREHDKRVDPSTPPAGSLTSPPISIGSEALPTIGRIGRSTNQWFETHYNNSNSNSNSNSNNGGRSSTKRTTKLESFKRTLQYYCPYKSLDDLYGSKDSSLYIRMQRYTRKSVLRSSAAVDRPSSVLDNGFSSVKQIFKTNDESVLSSKSALKQSYPTSTSSPSSIPSYKATNANSNTKLTLVIFQRDSTRQIQNFDEFVSQIYSTIDVAAWDIHIIYHREWTHPCAVLNALGRADFFLTTHGFQSTSVLFMKPKSAILEIFPFHYYKSTYIPLASAFDLSYFEVQNEKPTTWNRQALKYMSQSACMSHKKCRSHARNDLVYISEANQLKIVNYIRQFGIDRYNILQSTNDMLK